MKYCTQCGNAHRGAQAFCVRCGAPVRTAQSVRVAEPAPVTAALVDDGDVAQASEVSPRLARRSSWWRLLSDARMRRRIVGAVAKALVLNTVLTALVLIPGVLLSAWHALAGMVWLFTGSFTLMARTYSRPWRLMWITCLLPAVAAALSYGLQWWMFGQAAPAATWTLAAGAAGLLVGVLRARTHLLYVEKGAIMARRTVLYLAVWALAFIGTQVLGSIGAAKPLIHGGLLTSAFSAAMLIAVSMTILAKFQSLRSHLSVAATNRLR